MWGVRSKTSARDGHDGMRLVVGDTRTGQYYVVKNIRDDPSFANMEKTVGVLPEL